MKKFHYVAIATAIIAQASAAVTVTVTDRVFDGANGTGTRNLSILSGGAGASLSAPAVLPTFTYTLSNLDLQGVGGGASETVVFNVSFSQSGGTGLQFTSFGNISVTGAPNNIYIDGTETATATVALSSTTFAGDIAIGFTRLFVGDVGTNETWNTIHDGGTVSGSQAAGNNNPFPVSSFFTLDPTSANANLTIQGYNIDITATEAVPEPSAALLGSFGILLLLRRRRA